MTDYTNLPAVKDGLGIASTDLTQDDAISAAITAASRSVDLLTGTVFGATEATARTFRAANPYRVWVDRFTDTTDLVIETGTGGVYDQPVDTADYILWPYNLTGAQAYTRIEVPGGSLNLDYYRPTVRVTAIWGFGGDVPAPIESACRIMAAALYRRKDSPEGEAGAMEDGTPIDDGLDAKAVQLLTPYAVGGPLLRPGLR